MPNVSFVSRSKHNESIYIFELRDFTHLNLSDLDLVSGDLPGTVAVGSEKDGSTPFWYHHEPLPMAGFTCYVSKIWNTMLMAY